MLSTVILRLIKEAILPVVTIIGGKILGIILVTGMFSLSWQLSNETVVPRLVFASSEYTVLVNSYSNLIMYLAAIAGLAVVLTKAYHFHDTHVAPGFILKLLSWNLTWLLTDSKEIYYRGVVWLSYIWLVTLYILLQTFLSQNTPWIAGVILIASIVVSWLYIADIEREVIRYESNR